jgi:GWxTD domain-containing protein
MKIRTMAAAALVAAAAVNGFALPAAGAAVTGNALSEKLAGFAKGPEQFLMTREEQAQWKEIRTDAGAQAFIDLFWLRRDPTPATSRNEFRDNFEGAVRYADEHFAAGRRRGSLSDRGRIFLIYGTPAAIRRIDAPGMDGQSTARISFVYEGARAKEIFGQEPVELTFADPFDTGEFTLERGRLDLNAAQRRVIESEITRPNVTLADVARAAAPLPVAAKKPVLASLKTAALQAAVDDFRAGKTMPSKGVAVSYGEFVTAAGDEFVPLALYVPKTAGFDASRQLAFFGVVYDGDRPVAWYEEPARLTESKGDFYFDRSLTLPNAKLHGIFGLAENGKPVAMAASDLDLSAAIDKDKPAVSNLILSNNLYTLKTELSADDPFTFGGIKVVPKPDRTFSKKDELWYFYELRNPGVDDAGHPRIQMKLELDGTAAANGEKVSRLAPPSEVEANPLKGVPGHYGVGSAIPLEALPPGEYTLRVKVSDTVRKTSYNLQDHFKIVGEGK